MKVAERALQLWPNNQKYVSSFAANLKKVPQTVSFDAVKAVCDDPPTVAKLQFIVSVATQLETRLIKFQTDAPMAPSLGQSLKDLLTTLNGRFIKKDDLDKANTYQKLVVLDPTDKTNQLQPKRVEIGIAARQSLEAVTDQKSVSELGVLAFNNECVKLLSAMTAKLIERCPLKYPLVRYLPH